jgi:flagellar protein FliS
MLFDSALGSISLALEGFELSRPVERNEKIHNGLTKAIQVLSVLQAALDLSVEGEFPSRMYALYDFMISELQKSNSRKASESVLVVRGMLQEIRDAWSEMLINELASA